MFWYLFFGIILIIVTFPINIKSIIKFNLLNLKSELYIEIYKIKLIKIKIKFKKGFVYITKNKITYKEKLTASNINVVFLINFLKNFYYRTIIMEISNINEIGIKDDAFHTAYICESVDIVLKTILRVIKNNKVGSHIFVYNSTNYDEDCVNSKLEVNISFNLFDFLVSFMISKFTTKGVKYERIKEREES